MRKRVPVALHSELSEYSSLIRALRTGAAQDVVPHLLPDREVHEPAASPTRKRPLEDPQTSDQPSTKRTKSESRTRWPLVIGDLKVPEWGFIDEIKRLVVQQVLHSQQRDEHDISAEESIPESVVVDVASHTSTYLASVLALIVAHTPPRPDSMQCRVKPINWESVMNILETPGNDLDKRCTQHVRDQLRKLYQAEGVEESMTSIPHPTRLEDLDKDLLELPDIKPQSEAGIQGKGKGKEKKKKKKTKKKQKEKRKSKAHIDIDGE